MNDNAKMPYVKATLLPDGKTHIEMTNMTLLQTMGVSLILMDKVHERLKGQGSMETAELVASVLQAMSALVQLADHNSKGH